MIEVFTVFFRLLRMVCIVSCYVVSHMLPRCNYYPNLLCECTENSAIQPYCWADFCKVLRLDKSIYALHNYKNHTGGEITKLAPGVILYPVESVLTQFRSLSLRYNQHNHSNNPQTYTPLPMR